MSTNFTARAVKCTFLEGYFMGEKLGSIRRWKSLREEINKG